MKFKKPELEDFKILQPYFKNSSIRDCAFCAGNAILWSSYYHVKYCVIDEMLVYITEEEGKPSSFTFPIGRERNYGSDLENPSYLDEAKKVFDKVCLYFKEHGQPIILHCVTPQVFQVINEWYPDLYQYIPSRDSFDYIYTVEKLTKLSGSKLHGKRNHINNFMKAWPDYIYEDITEDNRNDCLAVAHAWMERHTEMSPEHASEYEYEYRIIEESLRHMHEMNMLGGLIKIQDTPIAFTVGEPISKDTFDIHFEKADENIQGAYPMINREFVSRRLQAYTYVNREEDLGLPGLRKSKLSYVPDILYEKGVVREK